jgi:hypothetical protein
MNEMLVFVIRGIVSILVLLLGIATALLYYIGIFSVVYSFRKELKEKSEKLQNKEGANYFLEKKEDFYLPKGHAPLILTVGLLIGCGLLYWQEIFFDKLLEISAWSAVILLLVWIVGMTIITETQKKRPRA